jgi:DeoR family transcriptional regulator of aga operon
MRKTSRNGKSERLISAQRQTFILDILNQQKAASIQQLADRMGVSFSTVRRDLNYLADAGFIMRTHGGATLGSGEETAGTVEPAAPLETFRGAKVAIGAVAAKRIHEGQSVIFDSSTTVLEAARSLCKQRIRFTAVTSNLQIATAMAREKGVRLIVLGGTVRPGTFALYGEPAMGFLRQLNVDVALIGGQHIANGTLTDSQIESATMKQTMMAVARRKILLMDSWKFGGPGFCNVADLADFDEVITDEGLPEEERANLERLGVTLTIAPSDEEPEIADFNGGE